MKARETDEFERLRRQLATSTCCETKILNGAVTIIGLPSPSEFATTLEFHTNNYLISHAMAGAQISESTGG